MMTYLDCWIGAATALLSQALAGEPELVESLPKPLESGAFGFAATVAGDLEGRLAVILDGAILAAPLMGEGVDQKASWGELLREVAEAAAGELLAKTGKKCRVEKFEEIGGESKVSRAFQLKSADHDWTILVRDEVRAPKPQAKAPAPERHEPPPPRVPAGMSPGIELLLDVELEATLRFGCRELPLGEVLDLGPGDVVQLDRHILDPVDLIVGDKIVARGEVVLVNGNFGLRVTEVAAPRSRLESIRCLFLSRRTEATDRSLTDPRRVAATSSADPRRGVGIGLFESCSNAGCGSGWLHLWRSRSAPVIEGGWTCSAACTAERMQAVVRRELEGRGSAQERHRHRVPLGLLMLEQGWITAGQLRRAIDGQKAAGSGRLGQWLVAQQAVSEQLVTRALTLQWSCPVLPLEFHDPEALTPLIPRLFVDAFGALPLRVAAGKLLYLGFEDRLDPVLALAVERMTGLRVESGLVQESLFRASHDRMLKASFPPVELLEAASEPAVVRALARAVERVRPVESRLVRVHDCLWLRMWRKAQNSSPPEAGSVQDLICTIGAQ